VGGEPPGLLGKEEFSLLKYWDSSLLAS